MGLGARRFCKAIGVKIDSVRGSGEQAKLSRGTEEIVGIGRSTGGTGRIAGGSGLAGRIGEVLRSRRV